MCVCVSTDHLFPCRTEHVWPPFKFAHALARNACKHRTRYWREREWLWTDEHFYTLFRVYTSWTDHPLPGCHVKVTGRDARGLTWICRRGWCPRIRTGGSHGGFEEPANVEFKKVFNRTVQMKNKFPKWNKKEKLENQKGSIQREKDVNQIITRASATVVTTPNKRQESSDKGFFTFPYMSFLYETGWWPTFYFDCTVTHRR